MFSETFSALANRFQTWYANQNIGALVTNIRLEYLNRANRWIQLYEPWEGLLKDTALTVTNSQATLPTDFLKLVAVAYDSDSDKKPEYYYFSEGRQGQGYTIRETYDKDTGITRTLYLFLGFPYNPNHFLYQYELEAFEDDGTEYLYFPLELILCVAQLIVIEETNPNPNQLTTLTLKRDKLLKMYKRAKQHVNQGYRNQINDDNGQPITLETNTLSGYTTQSRIPVRNDQDTG